jgi:hypothetical protein
MTHKIDLYSEVCWRTVTLVRAARFARHRLMRNRVSYDA